MISPSVLEDAVHGALASVIDIDRSSITNDLDLSELGLDSLDLTTVVLEIESRLDVEVPANVLDQIAELDGDASLGAVLRLLGAWTRGKSEADPAFLPPVVISPPVSG